MGLMVAIDTPQERADRVLSIGDNLLTLTLPDLRPSILLDGERIQWDPGRIFFRMRLRWLWTDAGRMELHLNDQLVAFRNSVHPDRRFVIPSVSLGPGDVVEEQLRFLGTLEHVMIDVLTKDDAMHDLARLVGVHPDCEKPSKAEPAVGEKRASHLEAMLRGFLVSETKKQWQFSSTDEKGPFSESAIEVHRLALEIARLASAAIASRTEPPPELGAKLVAVFTSMARSDPEAFCRMVDLFERAEAQNMQSRLRGDERGIAMARTINNIVAAAARDVAGGKP